MNEELHKLFHKEKCYSCKHRCSIPGDVHTRCNHPIANTNSDPLNEIMAIFASVGRVSPQIDLQSAIELGIKGDEYGIRMGWFNWPYNFDPIWLKSCNGFEVKEVEKTT